jgi:hypothetical protein
MHEVYQIEDTPLRFVSYKIEAGEIALGLRSIDGGL